MTRIEKFFFTTDSQIAGKVVAEVRFSFARKQFDLSLDGVITGVHGNELAEFLRDAVSFPAQEWRLSITKQTILGLKALRAILKLAKTLYGRGLRLTIIVENPFHRTQLREMQLDQYGRIYCRQGGAMRADSRGSQVSRWYGLEVDPREPVG